MEAQWLGSPSEVGTTLDLLGRDLEPWETHTLTRASSRDMEVGGEILSLLPSVSCLTG